MSDQPRAILDQNAFDFGKTTDPSMHKLLTERQQLLGPTAMLFYNEPLHIEHSEGVWLFDTQQKKYLDAYNNVPVVGHCHPAVVAAVHSQMQTLNIHTRYLHELIQTYAARLIATTGMDSGQFVPTCSGSEANDLALRIAREATEKKGIIVSECAYHGNTTAVTEVSPSSYKRGTVPDYVVTVPLPNINAHDFSPAEFIHHVDAAWQLLEDRGYGCAAFILDSIFSSDGVLAEPKGFIKPAVDELQKRGTKIIADEVQAGFARTGEAFWGFLRHGIKPDIITLGKPMANGYPAAGLISTIDLLQPIASNTGYFNTFGGSHAAMAAATAVLDIIEKENLQHQALVTGRLLKDKCLALQLEFPLISDVRGVGLYLGIDIQNSQQLASPKLTSWIINHLKQNGVLIGAAGKFGQTLKIRPPLVFDATHVDIFMGALHNTLLAAMAFFDSE